MLLLKAPITSYFKIIPLSANPQLYTAPLIRSPMRYASFLLFFIICASKNYGQAPANCYGRVVVTFLKEKRPKRMYAIVDTASIAPCLDSAWVRSLEKNINQSISYRNGAKKGKYIVRARFIIAKDKTLSDIQCENDPGFGMCQELLRVLKKSVAPWRPAVKTIPLRN
jgi:hypothetical protein